MSLFHLTVLLGYGAAALALGFTLRGDREGETRVALSSLAVAAGLLAVLLHARHLWIAMVLPEGWLPSVANVISLFGWGLGLLAVIASSSRELRVMAMPLFGFAGATSLSTGFGDPDLSGANFSPELALHVALSLLAYGLLAVATLMAVFLRLQDHWLRNNQLRGWRSSLPPLFVTERLLFMLLSLGWLLLTLAQASGFLLLDDMFARNMAPKTLLTLAGWAILTVLLGGHLRWGWRGRRTTQWTLGSFGLLLVAYIGSRVMLGNVV